MASLRFHVPECKNSKESAQQFLNLNATQAIQRQKRSASGVHSCLDHPSSVAVVQHWLMYKSPQVNWKSRRTCFVPLMNRDKKNWLLGGGPSLCRPTPCYPPFLRISEINQESILKITVRAVRWVSARVPQEPNPRFLQFRKFVSLYSGTISDNFLMCNFFFFRHTNWIKSMNQFRVTAYVPFVSPWILTSPPCTSRRSKIHTMGVVLARRRCSAEPFAIQPTNDDNGWLTYIHSPLSLVKWKFIGYWSWCWFLGSPL